jgi:hypothetical protein
VLRAPLDMTAHRRFLTVFGMPVLALVVGAAAPRAAEAHGRVVIGIGAVYPHPYHYPPPPFLPYPVPVWAATPAVPPPGWEPGRWERRYDRAGRPYDVWVPPHLR